MCVVNQISRTRRLGISFEIINEKKGKLREEILGKLKCWRIIFRRESQAESRKQASRRAMKRQAHRREAASESIPSNRGGEA